MILDEYTSQIDNNLANIMFGQVIITVPLSLSILLFSEFSTLSMFFVKLKKVVDHIIDNILILQIFVKIILNNFQKQPFKAKIINIYRVLFYIK